MTKSLLDGQFSVNELQVSFKRHKILVAIIFLAIATGAVYLAISKVESKPIYIARTAIQVLLSRPAEQIDPTLNKLNLPITLKSPPFMEALFPASNKIDNAGNQLPGDLDVKQFFENLTISVPDATGVIKISFKAGSAKTAELGLKKFVESALEKIKILQEEKTKESEQKKVSITGISPENRLRNLSKLLDTTLKTLISGSDESGNLQLWQSMFSALNLTNTYLQFEIDKTRQELNEIKKAFPPDIIRVVEPISIVPPKFKPNTTRVIILIGGLALAGLLAMATALGLDRNSGLINSQIDVEGLAPNLVSLVPQISAGTDFVQQTLSETTARSTGESSPELQAALSACENVIVGLGLADQAHGLKTIFIGSGKKTEGKTFMALSLAIQAAQAGKKTLLLDCNFRNPKIATVLKCGDRVGFSAFLKNRQKIDDLPAIQTSFPGLSCVTAGQISKNPLPLFLADHFREILYEIRKNFDYIFIDTPAILDYAEAVAISALCDAQILVVRQVARSSLAQLETAVKNISHKDRIFLGIIMNGFDG